MCAHKHNIAANFVRGKSFFAKKQSTFNELQYGGRLYMVNAGRPKIDGFAVTIVLYTTLRALEPHLCQLRLRSGTRSFIMRVLIGIVLGVLLTVGATYLYDSHYAVTTANASSQRPMVNWDVVSNKWNHLTTRAKAEWVRIAG
jgi:hypothetical protein